MDPTFLWTGIISTAISYLQFIELQNSSKTQKAGEPQNQVNQKAVLKTAPSFALRTANNFFYVKVCQLPEVGH